MNRATQEWGSGPWDDESDEPEEWVDERTGLFCIVERGPVGALCGYVAVFPQHSLYGVDMSELSYLYCRGGVTYAGRSTRHPGYWLIGFDCSHHGDYAPYMNVNRKADRLWGSITSHVVYRDWAYVKSEVLRLAEQMFNPLEALSSCLDTTTE